MTTPSLNNLDYNEGNDYKRTIGPYKVSEPYLESRQAFFLELARNLGPVKERKPISQEELFAMQQPSTQKRLRMTEEEIKEYWNSPLPEQAQLSDEEINLKRDISIEEFDLYRNHQHTAKNTAHTENLSSSPEAKERAVHAYMFHPPTDITQDDAKRITGLKQIKSREPIELPKMRKWYEWGGSYNQLAASYFEELEAKRLKKPWWKRIFS